RACIQWTVEWQYAFRHTSLVLETMSVREAHDVSVLSQLDPEGPAAWPVAIQDYVAAAGVLRGQILREFPTIVVAVPGLDELEPQKYDVLEPLRIERLSGGTEIISELSVPGKRKGEHLEEWDTERAPAVTKQAEG
ncbi:MAG: hypothetical protein LQ340_005647, partial [Diploschistes diacapsis]